MKVSCANCGELFYHNDEADARDNQFTFENITEEEASKRIHPSRLRVYVCAACRRNDTQ